MASTARQQVRTWAKEQITHDREISIPDLATECVQFFRQDHAFVDALLNETIRAMCYEQIRIVVQDTRRECPGPAPIIMAGDRIVSRGQILEAGKAFAQRWATWLEHVGDRHVRLLDMTSADLRTAAAERRKRADHELTVVALWDTLARRLKPDETVGKRFSVEDIERINQQLQNSKGDAA